MIVKFWCDGGLRRVPLKSDSWHDLLTALGVDVRDDSVTPWCVNSGAVVKFSPHILKVVYCPDALVLRLIVARVKPSAQSFEEHFRLPQLQGSTKTVSSDSTGNTITDTDATNEDDIIDIASFADNGRLFLMRRSNSLKTTAATKLRVPRESERMLQETTNSCAALKRADEKYVPKVLSSESEVLMTTSEYRLAASQQPTPQVEVGTGNSRYIPAVLSNTYNSVITPHPESSKPQNGFTASLHAKAESPKYVPLAASSKYVPAVSRNEKYTPAATSTKFSLSDEAYVPKILQ
mmetsp:Transcript_23841/g.34865  ORF Transcript_23841/g.34865 Transcript_23841/m.34865 type:complete len:292 (-) Transcript_23841:136-1011(-)|eukprot:CAMPEP_0195513162 /NCGR_PEP_ID=MMETSP0794_2-20130614/4879_1 /TAXON_ID=515487 /ORGANISM="Stephanopyxis turris, Strain CCMP 815" /LENGTH=291 /DNA_ID=CAMNT_0040641099 /DNA_START=98 /DNA_END=973 /DNA_ORIENTATION=+